MTANTRPTGPLALAAAAAVAFAAVLAPLATPAAPAADAGPNAACSQALAYERTASNDAISRQAAYDSAVAGLTANQRCTDPQMRLVNEGYLLSMRAGAEHELKIGNWQRDLERANMLLAQCANWPGLRGTKAGNDCNTQRQYNQITYKNGVATPAPDAVPAVLAAARAEGFGAACVVGTVRAGAPQIRLTA